MRVACFGSRYNFPAERSIIDECSKELLGDSENSSSSSCATGSADVRTTGVRLPCWSIRSGCSPALRCTRSVNSSGSRSPGNSAPPISSSIGPTPPIAAATPELARFGEVINLRATNISKTNVERIHAEIFGYTTAIDPLTYRGPCLRKSDVNALHDGAIVQCPIEKLESGFVYEKLIDNMTSAGALDMRVPIFGSILPLVYHKTRSLKARFLTFHSATLRETGRRAE